MRAMVYTGPLRLEVLEVPPPEPSPDEAMVKVAAAGVCGSEVEGFANQSPFRVPPLVMGHEFAGTRLADGALVTVNPLVACGNCRACQDGRSNICDRRTILGIQRDGGFAEFVTVPAANCHELPAGVSALRGALVEPLANAVHALRMVDAEAGAGLDVGKVAIIGCGMVGVALLSALRARGRVDVTMSDLSPERRAIAEAAGASRVESTVTGTFDLVFDSVGAAPTRALSLNVLRAGGTAVWIGLHEAGSDADCQAMIRTEKQVVTSFCYTDADFSSAIPLAAQADESWVQMVDLSQGPDVFAQLMRGPSPTLKTVLVP